MKRRLESLYYSFPVQLLVLHTKKNLVLTLLWILLVVIITSNFGQVFGVHYLFLDPEYLNLVNFWSFLLVGLSFGGLITAFHITCYILYGQKYVFVGILEKPFLKFSLNNSIIPVTVMLLYAIQIVRFQLLNQFTTFWGLAAMLAGFLSGTFFTLTVLYGYFSLTNKDIFKFLTGSVDMRLRKVKLSRLNALKRLKETKEYRYRVDSYLTLKLRLQSTEGLVAFYDKESVIKVFDQNHFNSVVVELFAIMLILVLGLFMDQPYFKIPAAASAILILTILMMLTGAISYWFRSWGTSITLLVFLGVNMMVKYGVLEGRPEATGMDYYAAVAPYNLETLEAANSKDKIDKDRDSTIAILERWKSKNAGATKPKAIFVCVSGGGQRAALWSMSAMSSLDSALGGQLMDKTVLVTGASGGMVGAAYYRELYCQSILGRLKNYNDDVYKEKIAKDILNPIIFSLLVNDLFIRAQFFNYEDRKYQKDRGYAFEQQINLNTDSLMDKPLIAYGPAEKSADIPMLLLAPTISNDGRKLYLSPQPVSYMNIGHPELHEDKIMGVDFMSFFKEQDAGNLRFLSALRMNASFPYITPNIELPSDPALQIMDAGISDNYGISDATRFLFNFKDWFAENTSGIVFISIRDSRKNSPIEQRARQSIIESFSQPISSVYNNLGNLQDINNDAAINFAKAWYQGPIDVVNIEYNTTLNVSTDIFTTDQELLKSKQIEKASLSWHLTAREKRSIMDNIDMPKNVAAVKKVKELVGE
jgi:hypothetical protein